MAPHHDAIVGRDTIADVDESQWKAFRRLVRTRAARQAALILIPFLIAILVLKITEPTDYPAGDVRNDMAFRIGLYGLGIALLILILVVSIRGLLADRQR
jgi:hypothetical protein